MGNKQDRCSRCDAIIEEASKDAIHWKRSDVTMYFLCWNCDSKVDAFIHMLKKPAGSG